MSISERFRRLCQDIDTLAAEDMSVLPDAAQMASRLDEALVLVRELADRVGDIPQYKLETELTPVLLKAHSRLDQYRLKLEHAGQEALAQRVWGSEQDIYRLLNSL